MHSYATAVGVEIFALPLSLAKLLQVDLQNFLDVLEKLAWELFVYGRASGSGGSTGSAFCFPYNSVTVRRILFKLAGLGSSLGEFF